MLPNFITDPILNYGTLGFFEEVVPRRR